MHTLEIVLGEWHSFGVKLDGKTLPVESILVDASAGKPVKVSLVGVERGRFEANFPWVVGYSWPCGWLWGFPEEPRHPRLLLAESSLMRSQSACSG